MSNELQEYLEIAIEAAEARDKFCKDIGENCKKFKKKDGRVI